MPVDPNNPYVDVAHPKTIGDASAGWRYSCHNKPRPAGNVSVELVQLGWTEDGRRITEKVETRWLPGGCRHDKRAADPGCEGCQFSGRSTMAARRRNKPHVEYLPTVGWYCSCGMVGRAGETAEKAYQSWKKELMELFPPYSSHYRLMLSGHVFRPGCEEGQFNERENHA